MSADIRHKILIVDDEPNNIDALYGILKPTYDIVVAKNGEAAVQKAVKHNPDLILLDIILPDTSGFDVIVILKETEITRKTPVIFITGLDSTEYEERGLLLGAVDYITKPFNNSIVKARVKTHLQIVEYINTIERLCNMDALTNVDNRRSLDSHIAYEWGRAMRDEKPLGFFMVDIDHFKKYNDTYGHPQGDLMLQTVAGVLKNSLFRSSDLVARWGGEEFAVLLPDANMEGAMAVAERLRANVAAIAPSSHGTMAGVTISIGVNSEIPSMDSSVQDFLSHADKALYKAKISGRNRVCSADEISD